MRAHFPEQRLVIEPTVNIAGYQQMRLLVWHVVNKTLKVSSHVSNIVMLTINSRAPSETISGFKLTVTRREKRQGMKLHSGLRTICVTPLDLTSLTRGNARGNSIRRPAAFVCDTRRE